MIRKSPISWYLLQDKKHSNEFNNHNLHTYDPYYEREGILYIDESWWKDLTPWIQQAIIARVKTPIEYIKMEIPHSLDLNTIPNSEGLLTVYRAYLQGFDYHLWYHDKIENGPKNVRMIKLGEGMKESLTSICRRRILMRDEFNESEEGDFSFLRAQIQENIDHYAKIGITELFVRLSGTSGKNEIALEPLYTVDDILRFLTGNRLFLNQEYSITDKETYIIMMPWNNELNERYEFRIFVKDGKLTGISQQKWFELYQYSDEELEELELAFSNLVFLKDLPYHTFVGDVYVSKGVCYLIECNPFGAHCGAGSALFNWQKDDDQLNGRAPDGKAEFKFLSILSY